MYDYDPEVPAGYQDADILQASYEAESARAAQLKRDGYCTHGSWIGRSDSGEVFYPEQEGLTGTQVRCTGGCAQLFESSHAIVAAAPIRVQS